MSKYRLEKQEERERKQIERLEKKEFRNLKKAEKTERRQSLRKTRSKSMGKGFGYTLLTGFLVTFHVILDTILNFVLGLYWGDVKRVCPPLTNDTYLMKSAVELAGMIRRKELKSEDLVAAYTQRIKETNPMLNFLTDGPFEEALVEARSIDERIAKGLISEDEFSEKPFLGLPFTTKDSTAVKGRLNTLGIKSRRNVRAKEDAECIRLIKEAGGISIALTNVPEINRWQETRNNIYGQTCNPYDTRRTVGGSSGGEGAAISSCSTAFGIGTDIGGSIRMPAFYCGIYGHKPTTHIIDTKGCTFRTGKEPHTMVVAGPMCRHATDLMPLFKVMAGPKNCISLQLDEPVDVTKLKYYYITQNGEFRTGPISADLRDAMGKVISHFNNISETPAQAVKLAGTEYSSKLWRYWMTQEPANFGHLLGNGNELNPLVELAKKLIGQSDYTLASIFSLIDGMLPPEKEHLMKEITKKLEDDLENLLGDDGILFYHSTTNPAPFHYYPFVKIWNFSYWNLFNVLQVPATQVPLGLNANGIPLGIQVVAGKNRDRLCLAVAEEIEKAYGGWVPPDYTHTIKSKLL